MRRSNCLIVAAAIWLRSGARHLIAVRRSVSFAGLIPHFSLVRERGDEIVVIDYIPRRRKSRLISDGDSVLLFNGLYRVRRYRVEASGEGGTLREAARATEEAGRLNRQAFLDSCATCKETAETFT